MSDKDQFTFDDDDDDGFPETSLDNQDEPQELNLGDEDDFPGTNPDNHDESPGLDLGDNDDFPETDLNAAFSEGEYVAEESLQKEPERMQSAGNSRTRILLMLLLLVIVGGAGAYYFLSLGDTAPSPPALPVVQTSTQSVDLPPQPGKASATQVKTGPAAMPASVTVTPPPPPAEPAAPAEQPDAAVSSPAAQAATSEEKALAEKPKKEAAEQPEQVVVPVTGSSSADTKPASEPALAQEKAAVTAQSTSRSAESTTSVEPSLQVVDAAFALDAGSYLLESNRDSLVTKIRKLGYEPLITPVDATLDMTRLRLGTFDQEKVQETLDFARSIEPESYSLPAGDRYVIYAGTFLRSSNIDKLSQRFLEEGIKVYPEPVQVVRTLSRVRFGGFASKEEASVAARAAADAGVKATIVKSP